MRLKVLVKGFCLIILTLQSIKSNAQAGKGNLASDSSFYGIWKGTSICQVKNSPCHDEIVVYYISYPDKDRIIEIKANKMVNGAEEEMGIIQFRFDAKTGDLVSISQPNAIWRFKIKQNTLEGTLYNNNSLYRVIKVTKA